MRRLASALTALIVVLPATSSAQTAADAFGRSRDQQLIAMELRLHEAPSPAPDRLYVEPLLSLEYLKLVASDVAHVVTGPAHWDQADWQRLGFWSAAIVVTGVALDHPLRAAVQRSDTPGLDHALKEVEPFGQKKYAFPTLAAFYLYGLAEDDPNARATAQDGVAANLVASGLVTPALKGLFGRSRPRQNRGAGHFQPLGGDTSFPSGHATGAFTAATVIADHYPEPWVKGVSYGIASLVAVARIDHNAHFASDVLAGAMIGHGVAQSVVRYNAEHRAARSSWQPEVAAGADGIALAWRW